MAITELNAQEFAKNLAQQAMGYVPDGFSEEQKSYIAKKVYEFSAITGDHLMKQYQEKLSDEQAIMIIQFIGEWTFHKAIDMMRSGLDAQHWDQILQQVAFAALKGALHATIEGFDESQRAQFIEENVKKAYEECIQQLIQANAISEETANAAVSQSNVDQMAEQTAERKPLSPEEEEATMKYVTIALYLKKLPQEKSQKVLEKLEKLEREKIISCLEIEGLEQKVNAQVVNKYMQSLMQNICQKSSSKPRINEIIKAFKSLQDKIDHEAVINLTMLERANVQRFISECLFETEPNVANVNLSPYVAKILYNYVKSKLQVA